MAASVRELELDLDAFEGPFDLLLTLVLKDALEPAEIDIAAIVVAFVEHLAERDELDLEACGEFLVLVAALLELKARGLFPDEQAELAELEPEEAAEELARRLAEHRTEALDELRDGREAQRHVVERHPGRVCCERAQRVGEHGGSLRLEAALRDGRERRRPEPEVPVALGLEAFAQPAGRLLHAAVLGQTAGELLGRLLGLELGELGLLVGEEPTGFELEQRGHEHQELPTRLEIELRAHLAGAGSRRAKPGSAGA